MGIRSSVRNFFYAATHANQLVTENQRLQHELAESGTTIAMQADELRAARETQGFMERHEDRLKSALQILSPREISLDTLRSLYIAVRDTAYDYEKAGQYLLGHQWYARGYVQHAPVWDVIEKEIYLTNIEAATDGAYIHANSADAMEDLYAAILDAVNLNFVDTDDDGENDSLMVADSGFRPEVNGLPIRNTIVFGDGFRSAGMCYGFSTFCSLYYQQKLPTEMGSMDITDWNLWYIRPLFADDKDVIQPYVVPGFTSNDFALAGFEVDSSGKLTYSLALGEWESEVMDRYYEYFNWPLSSEYFAEVDTGSAAFSGLYYTEKAEAIIASEDFMRVAMLNDQEYPAFDLTVDASTLSGDSLATHALLRILMRYQVSQYNIATTENYTYKFAADFETIDHALTSGIPLVLCTSDHAVNVCRMRQNLENPNLYYLDLYDSNYCGAGTTMTAEIRIDADGNRYTEFQYGSTFSDVTFYDPHF